MKFRWPYDPATGLPGDGSEPWTNGDPATGTQGSIPPAEALNDPQAEICKVIDEMLGDGSAGSGQVENDLGQLFASIKLMAGLDPSLYSLADPGYLILPLTHDHGTKFILQWGKGQTDTNGDGTVIFPIAFPNARLFHLTTDNAISDQVNNVHVVAVRPVDEATDRSQMTVYSFRPNGNVENGTAYFYLVGGF